jgi:hypothetical protein
LEKKNEIGWFQEDSIQRMNPGRQSFEIASDCANVVRSLLDEEFGRYGPIIREINVRRRSFTRAEFVHEGRKSNVGAHLLARSSVNLSIGRHVWSMKPSDRVRNSYVIILNK